MRITLRLKGGEGSGNHGHRGRPGLVGGSSRADRGTDYVVDPNVFWNPELLPDVGNVHYWLMPNDVVYRSMSHSESAQVFLKDNGIKFSNTYDDPVLKMVNNTGAIRIFSFDNETYVGVRDFDKATLRRLQDLYSRYPRVFRDWVRMEKLSGNNPSTESISVEKFLSANDYKLINPVSMEYRLVE